MKYYIYDFGTDQIVFTILDDGCKMFIPEDSGNTDYQKYVAWVAEGNEPEIAEL